MPQRSMEFSQVYHGWNTGNLHDPIIKSYFNQAISDIRRASIDFPAKTFEDRKKMGLLRKTIRTPNHHAPRNRDRNYNDLVGPTSTVSFKLEVDKVADKQGKKSQADSPNNAFRKQ